MSLLRDLSDLMASAPDASQRAALDAVSAAVDARDWYRAFKLIDAIPPGVTSWHYRLDEARDRIQASAGQDDRGFIDGD